MQAIIRAARSLGPAVGVIGGSLLLGSGAALLYDARSSAIVFHPSTRATDITTAVSEGSFRKLRLQSGAEMNVFDSGIAGDISAVTLVVAVDSLSLLPLAHFAAVGASLGMRVLAYETEAPSSATVSSFLNAVQPPVSGPVMLVSGGLDWAAAVDFTARNLPDAAAAQDSRRPHVAGLILVDPVVPPPLEGSDAARALSESSRQQAREQRPPPLAPAGAAADTGLLAWLRPPVLTHTLDPLHALEHVLTHRTHHHLFCGLDHAAAPAAAVDTAGEAAPQAGSGVSARSWGSGLPSVVWRRKSTAAVTEATAADAARVAADNAGGDADMLDSAALHVEHVYRDRLGPLQQDGSCSSTLPSSALASAALRAMLPSFAQSFAPSYARGVTLTVALPLPASFLSRGAPLAVTLGGDPRLAQLDAKADDVARRWWSGPEHPVEGAAAAPPGLQNMLRDVAARVPLHVLLSTDTDGAGQPPPQSALEDVMRQRLADFGRARVEAWRDVLPGRVSTLPTQGQQAPGPGAFAGQAACEFAAEPSALATRVAVIARALQ